MYVAQEGGDHYQAQYQHWDWVTDCQMGYLPGNATKYISRWRKKGGVQDLKKAQTYLEKMRTILFDRPGYIFNHGNHYAIEHRTRFFISLSDMSDTENQLCRMLVKSFININDIDMALDMLEGCIRGAILVQEAQDVGAAMVGQQDSSMPVQASSGGAGCTTMQAPTTSGISEPHNKQVDGMEHPFGYDQWSENPIAGK